MTGGFERYLTLSLFVELSLNSKVLLSSRQKTEKPFARPESRSRDVLVVSVVLFSPESLE